MIKDIERCKQDGDYFRSQLGTNRGFLITWETVTEESAAMGDTENGGFDDYESCEPDEFDTEEGITAVDKAVRFLSERCVESSCSSFHEGLWYSDADGDTDWRTGEETRHSYHLENFTVEEQREIFRRTR